MIIEGKDAEYDTSIPIEALAFFKDAMDHVCSSIEELLEYLEIKDRGNFIGTVNCLVQATIERLRREEDSPVEVIRDALALSILLGAKLREKGKL